MTTEQHIRHRADGSIDTAFYTSQGRTRRSEAAHSMARGVIGPLVILFSFGTLVALLV
ncbi:hypothetical protein [Meridianimarinicoccus aquatilis]|uniref:hypothetical protein n=1 Tax=Meridianimarinicoccus aquatilis TaxID=2552766 RepID=UPI0013E01C8C|nr:hypothetical protein [Fluviibacterium aquatile]QIE41374.1 hypothetical protein G5B39_05035 [Rhodobacteraceae bacterium SC52]